MILVLEARDHRAACVADRRRRFGTGSMRRSRVDRPGVLRPSGQRGCSLRARVGASGPARRDRPGEPRPRRGRRPARFRVSGPRPADRTARVCAPCLRVGGVRHTGDRRFAGEVGPTLRAGRSRSGARTRPRLCRRLSGPGVGSGTARTRRRVRASFGVLDRLPRPSLPRRSARRRAGLAREVSGACRMGQRRGPGGSARVEQRGRGCRGIVVMGLRVIGGLCRPRRTCLLGRRYARAGLRCAGRLGLAHRGHGTGLQLRRIGDGSRLARSRLCDRSGLHRDWIPDRSRLLGGWPAIAARGRFARARRDLRQRRAGWVLRSDLLLRFGPASRARRLGAMARCERRAACGSLVEPI